MALSRVGFPRRLRKNMKASDVELLADIKTKLYDAREYRQSNREGHWKDNEKRYMGKQWPEMGNDDTADRIVVNRTFSTIANIVPFVTEGSVEFIVEPYSGTATSSSAKLVGIWLNRLWRTNSYDGVRHAAKAAWDALVYGDGFLYPVYAIKQQVVRGPNGEPLPYSEQDVADFMVENVSPWDVWIDRYATGLWDARWYIRKYVLPESLAKSDPDMSFRDQMDTMDTVDFYEDGRAHRANMREGNEVMVVLYEYYDRDLELQVTFSEGCEYPHRWLDHVGRNLVQLPNHPIPNMPYHMSEIEQITYLQDELNKTRSQMITQRRRNMPKIIYDKNAFDSSALTAFSSSIAMQGIPVDTASGPISELFSVVSPPPITEDAYNVAQIITNDMDEITGVNEYLRGVLSEIRRTATEASIIEGSSNTKIRHKLASVERALREVGQITLELAAEVLPVTAIRELELYLTGEEAMAALMAGGQDIYDEQGMLNDALLTPTPMLFQGKYEVFVQQGSTELRNPALKEQKMHKLVTTLMSAYPLLIQAGVFVDLSKALRLWLDSLGITDVNSILNSPQAIQAYEQQMIAQMMMAQAGAGVPGQSLGVGPMGQEQLQGEPNEAGAQAPEDLMSPENSGMLPPSPVQQGY